jgi:hypothetical protein
MLTTANKMEPGKACVRNSAVGKGEIFSPQHDINDTLKHENYKQLKEFVAAIFLRNTFNSNHKHQFSYKSLQQSHSIRCYHFFHVLFISISDSNCFFALELTRFLFKHSNSISYIYKL